MIEFSKKALTISGNKVSTVNFMELLQNPEVHQLNCTVFNINFSNKLFIKRHKNRSSRSFFTIFNTFSIIRKLHIITNTTATLGERNFKQVTNSAFQYVCNCP